MKNFTLFAFCAFLSFIPWGLLFMPLGTFVQGIGLAIQLYGIFLMYFWRKQIWDL